VRFVRENSLSLFFGAILLLALAGQSVAGQHEYNADAVEHGRAKLSWARYLISPEFGGDVLENWQSEFLQFSLYILATVWLVQRGSNESKPLDDAGLESDEQQRVGEFARPDSPAWARAAGLRRRIYSNSLLLLMATIFFLSWFGQSLNGWRSFNNAQDEHDGPPIAYREYLVNADFWDRTLQNWQSEFLAVGAMAVFTVYLRQRGSPESKPVGAPHDETGSSG
jgi:Domain of unknown function (DUF6766)